MPHLIRLINVLDALTASVRPVSPAAWVPMARALARAPGWAPSMLPVASFGAILFFSALFGRGFNGPIAQLCAVVTWATWGLVCCLAMSIGFVESARNMQRLGFFSLARPRPWFEIGRLVWHGGILTLIAAVACSYIAASLNLNALGTLAWSVSRTVAMYCVVLCAAAGGLGYGLSLIHWKLPAGRAFECVNFFLTLGIAIATFFFVEPRLPPAALWPDCVVVTVVAALGLTVLVAGILVGAGRDQRLYDRRNSRYASPGPVQRKR